MRNRCKCRQLVEVILERDPRDRNNPTRKFDHWIAWFGEDHLVEGSRDPEHDACRALLSVGITGRVTFRHKGSLHPSMFMDIEKAARFTVREDGRLFQLERYKPFSYTAVPPKNCDEGSGRYSPLPWRTNGRLRLHMNCKQGGDRDQP
jgi:hypothetical protein